MTVYFYQRDGGEDLPAAGLPDSFVIRTWCPARQGFPPTGSRRALNLAWWLMARAGLFARHDFTEFALWHEGRIVHRLIVTPRWYRFPFMAAADLQIGGLWTAPDLRRQGFASAMVAEACRRFGASRLWFVVEADNRASIRLAEACGFVMQGRGRRTKPLGLRGVGRFLLERNPT